MSVSCRSGSDSAWVGASVHKSWSRMTFARMSGDEAHCATSDDVEPS